MLSNQRGGNFLIVGLFLQTQFFASFHFPVFLFVISQLWLALARLETYENARKVRTKETFIHLLLYY